MKLLPLAGLLLGFASTAALAHGDTPADEAISYRQGIFRAMQWNFHPMAAMVQGRQPFDQADIERRAENLRVLAQMAGEGFVADSAEGHHVTSYAKPDIWWEQARFDSLLSDLRQRTDDLAKAVAAGDDRDALRPYIGHVAQACKSCHDRFRERR